MKNACRKIAAQEDFSYGEMSATFAVSQPPLTTSSISSTAATTAAAASAAAVARSDTVAVAAAAKAEQGIQIHHETKTHK